MSTSTSAESSTGPGASGPLDGSGSSSDASTTAAEQCDIVVDGPLEIDGAITYSPCYTPEDFACSTCSEWCTTAGLEPCAFVEALDACPSDQSGAPEATCDDAPMEGPFRCACGPACTVDPILLACLCNGEPSNPSLCGCSPNPVGFCTCDEGSFPEKVCGPMGAG